MFGRLKLPKHLQKVNLSPEAGLALVQRIETNSCSAEDRDILIKVIRATQASQQFLEASPLLSSLRLHAKPSASGS